MLSGCKERVTSLTLINVLSYTRCAQRFTTQLKLAFSISRSLLHNSFGKKLKRYIKKLLLIIRIEMVFNTSDAKNNFKLHLYLSHHKSKYRMFRLSRSNESIALVISVELFQRHQSTMSNNSTSYDKNSIAYNSQYGMEVENTSCFSRLLSRN